MNVSANVYNELSEVTGEIIEATRIDFAPDWMPDDAQMLTPDELQQRIDAAKSVNGKWLVLSIEPAIVNAPTEAEARGMKE